MNGDLKKELTEVEKDILKIKDEAGFLNFFETRELGKKEIINDEDDRYEVTRKCGDFLLERNIFHDGRCYDCVFFRSVSSAFFVSVIEFSRANEIFVEVLDGDCKKIFSMEVSDTFVENFLQKFDLL